MNYWKEFVIFVLLRKDFIKKLQIFMQPRLIMIQDKLHFAIHGQTAAELIASRAKAEDKNMGLTSWKGDKVRKQDVTIANNYLNENELRALNRIVTRYLDYAEDQAERKRPMYME